jgi:hypothetical protein
MIRGPIQQGLRIYLHSTVANPIVQKKHYIYIETKTTHFLHWTDSPENQQRNIRVKLYCSPNGHYRYL